MSLASYLAAPPRGSEDASIRRVVGLSRSRARDAAGRFEGRGAGAMRAMTPVGRHVARRGTVNSRLLMTLGVIVEGPQKIGAVPHGTRVTAPISGGRFEGPR